MGHLQRAADLGPAPSASGRSVAQWLEHRSPKPGVAGSSPSTPATLSAVWSNRFELIRTIDPRTVVSGRQTMAKISPFKFMQEVRAEAQKVTWPTRKETTITTIMVFVMVVIASIFFLLADQVMRLAVSFLLRISS